MVRRWNRAVQGDDEKLTEWDRFEGNSFGYDERQTAGSGCLASGISPWVDGDSSTQVRGTEGAGESEWEPEL